MDICRVQTCANRIAENETALKWLREYGPHLTGRDAASVTVHLAYASAVTGAKEAARILSSYASLSIPGLVESAIESCINTIELDRNAIREELDRADVSS